MNELSISNLPERAFCSEKVFLDKDYILLCPETPLLPRLKNRLLEWGYKGVLAYGTPEFTEFTSTSEAEGILVSKTSSETKEETESNNFFEDLCTFVEKLFESYKEGDQLKLNPISDKIKQLIQMMKTHKPYLLNLAEYESSVIDYNVSQSVKTAILAVAMGETLRLPAHKEIELGIAALLHRVGVMQIPSDLFYADRALTPEEKKSITLFPVLGFRSLKTAEFPLAIALAVLEHRENVNGTGYPRGLPGDKISLYGKLIAVASSYCAAVSQRPFRTNLDGHSGIMDLIKEKGRKYDEKVLRVLLLTITVYPNGTYVKMTDGSVGIVYQTNSAHPKYPILKILFDPEKRKYADPPIMHTSEDDEVQIETALTREEVIKLCSEKTGK